MTFLLSPRASAAATTSFAPARVGPALHPGALLHSSLKSVPTAESIVDFSSARSLFKAAVAAAAAARGYYALDGFVTEHRAAAEALARAYSALARFEPSRRRAAAMYCRAAELVGPLARSLNPSAYSAAVKELSHAEAAAWAAATDALVAAKAPAKEITASADAGRSANDLFLRGFADVRFSKEAALAGKVLPGASTTVDVDLAAPYALAHFAAARALLARRANSLSERADDAAMSLLRFNAFARVAKVLAGDSGEQFLQPQRHLAAELETLLPQKIALLRQGKDV